MAEKLLSNDDTLKLAAGADVEDEDEDAGALVVVGLVAFFDELQAVPSNANTAARLTPASTDERLRVNAIPPLLQVDTVGHAFRNLPSVLRRQRQP
ncbi:MAG TPA: hypothetical protein VKI19_14155 [Acidimicrobiales bacterium]|nr:hypothetical protein [Acidimicrobiales bacterium]